VDRHNELARLSPVVAKLQIRPGADDELPALVEALGERPFFADRLARQHQGGRAARRLAGGPSRE